MGGGLLVQAQVLRYRSRYWESNRQGGIPMTATATATEYKVDLTPIKDLSLIHI